MFETTDLTVGHHVIQAVYSGDSNYNESSSETAVTVAVVPATTSTTLSATTTPQGTTLTARVAVTSPGNPPINGTVSFYEGSVLLGTAPVIDGVAQLNAGTLPAGTIDFTSVFSGGGTSSASTSTSDLSTDGPQIVGLSRLGFNLRPTVIVLSFNQPLNVQAAQNPASYALYNSHGHHYALASVLYNPANLTVSIVPWRRLPVKGTFILEVVGSGANGVVNANGLELDGTGSGQPGSNFVTKFNWRALAAPNDPPAVIYTNGVARDRYLGGFAHYFHTVYAATQYFLQHVVPRNQRVPIVPAGSVTTGRDSVRSKIVLDDSNSLVSKKLVLGDKSLIHRKRLGRNDR
jgi:hypothetical protein